MNNLKTIDVQEFMNWDWVKIEPYYLELSERKINEDNVETWLKDWSNLQEYIIETPHRLYVATSVDTTDQEVEEKYNIFLDKIFPEALAAEQNLKEKLLSSKVEVEGFEIPLRNMRAEADLFCKENLPLQSEELKLGTEYDKIIGAQTISWEGEEITITQLRPVYQDTDRSKREKAWRSTTARQLADREAIDNLWTQFMNLRYAMAANKGFSDYRTYRWAQLLRFDYTPDDAKQFDRSILEVVVPLAYQIYEKRRQRLGLNTLRPWDLDVDPLNRPPLRPFDKIKTLTSDTSSIFHRVDPQLGEYFDIMRQEKLLDLDNRKGKAPGGYCIDFPTIGRPFIFMNAVGIHDDVQTLLHEGGHAFHVFETAHLPYHQQMEVGIEFAEVASMSMELLAAPYLTTDQGGFYSAEDAARARIEHLEGAILFWPYMAVVDLFQHWVYENHTTASNPENCDRKWGELWDRYMVGVDWSGFEDEKSTGWHRKLHIHQLPFYYVEYGMAQLGAMQVWHNAMSDQSQAVIDYRKALSLGGTAPLPQLYATAGAKFAFDAVTLATACELAENTINELEAIAK